MAYDSEQPEENVADSIPEGAAAPASPELTGGAGFTFEDGVAAIYATALLAETTAPGLPGKIVKQVSVQQGPIGHPLDDVIVGAEGPDEVCMRLSLQVKRKLTVSAAATNSDFKETIQRAHLTIVGAEFQLGIDRVGAVVNEIADSSKRDFETLCEWARSDSDTARFVAKLRTKGVAGAKAGYFDIVKGLISAISTGGDPDVATHTLLAHFVLMRMEMLHEGSTTEAQAVATLANCLQAVDHPRADDLWRRLLALVRVAEGMAASFDRKTLVSRLNGAFRLNGAPSLQGDIRRITEESRLAAAEVLNTVAGVSIPRQGYVKSSLDALQQSRLVLLGGLPGTGKSVVLRALVEEQLAHGAVLFIKTDRLNGMSWAQYATSTGLSGAALEDLLVELEAAGTPTVYIDGIDRVEVGNRRILQDIFNTILTSPLLRNWRILATLRDTGMEPVRTWLPVGLMEGGVQVIQVQEFDEAEARTLATACPFMEPLLFGNEQVRAIVRRPFFAAILVKRNGVSTQSLNSEVELATTWWLAGGYGAEAANAIRRRNALLQLARRGANQLGRKISSLDIDPEALTGLETDGIIRPIRAGLTVKFVHDIYFEWAFLQFLVSLEDRWIEVIREIGEPPVLGRIVELLSQVELTQGEEWHKHLAQLESTHTIRTQWLRAWLLGPFGLPTFEAYEPTYNAALLQDGTRHISRLAVWFQADKTRPNPIPFNTKLLPDLSEVKRWVWADLMALPSDYPAWRRFCLWLVSKAEQIPVSVRPEMTSVFEVWQNALSDYPNPVSEAILKLTDSWLESIESFIHSERFSHSRGPWEELRYGQVEVLESRLRLLLLKSGSAYPDMVRAYLDKWSTRKRLPRELISEVFLHASTLSKACPDTLVEFTLNALLEPLPDDVVKRNSRSQLRVEPDFSYHDWESLSIDDPHIFFPAAPTREPFLSLFLHASEQARELIKRLTNHANEAWRQLHLLSYPRRGTPIPLMLQFPWGEQAFWGSGQQYVWSRGAWGPKAVVCGLMALEAWAFSQLAEGREMDVILRDVLEGHQSVAVLGIGVALVLEAQHCSEVSFPLMGCQRIWAWDIQRYGQELTSGFANLMGFEPPEKNHYEAVKSSNARLSRRHEIRWLSSFCVARGGDLAARLATTIQSFPSDLPFNYEEERTDADVRAKLQRTAEIWAESGKPENYRFEVTEEGTKVSIHMDNPKAKGADIEAINQEHAELVEHLGLLNWVDRCFELRSLDTSLELNEAIRHAKKLDTQDLFENAQPHVSSGYRCQGIVAGVAALVLTYGSAESSDFSWAIDVCDRGWATPESPEYFVRSSVLLHHPVLYITRGMSALLDDSPLGKDAQTLLIQLAGHPYEQIGIEALAGILRAWQRIPEVSWVALELAIGLAMTEILPFGTPQEERVSHSDNHVQLLVQSALQKLDQRDLSPTTLTKMPPAWVPGRKGAPMRKSRRGRSVAVEWEHPSTEPDTAWLGKILGHIPIDAILADFPRKLLFLNWCDDLVQWTIERIYPTWARMEAGKFYEESSSELFEWRRVLFRFLGQLSLHLGVEESGRRFVAPATATDDKTFTSLAGYYVSCLACSVLDEVELPEVPIQLLSLLVERMVTCEGFRRANGRDGSLNDSDLSTMVRNVFFVEVERAGGAARFANGDWRDLKAVVPIAAPLLEQHGQVAVVTDAFLTRCERAFEHYPLDQFVAELSHILNCREGMPPGWRDRALPTRIASLIQRFSEKVQPLPQDHAQVLLRGLDTLVDLGDRRAAAVQTTEAFKNVRTE